MVFRYSNFDAAGMAGAGFGQRHDAIGAQLQIRLAVEVVVLHFALNDEDGVWFQFVAVVAEYLSEDVGVDAATAIVQRREGHLASPTTQGTMLDDNAGHRLRAGRHPQVADLLAAEAADFFKVFLNRMAVEIEPQRFLFAF